MRYVLGWLFAILQHLRKIRPESENILEKRLLSRLEMVKTQRRNEEEVSTLTKFLSLGPIGVSSDLQSFYVLQILPPFSRSLNLSMTYTFDNTYLITSRTNTPLYKCFPKRQPSSISCLEYCTLYYLIFSPSCADYKTSSQ